MLKKVTFKENYRCFKKGETYDFLPGINLLVGDQGTGKSSLLKLLVDSTSNKKIIDVVSDPIKFRFHDTEKDNPRIKPAVFTKFDVAARFFSHGEVQTLVTLSMKDLYGKAPELVLIDEPDTALSIRSLVVLIKKLEELAYIGHQLIISAHNMLLIQSQEEVLSLEHKGWKSPESFISLHLSDVGRWWEDSMTKVMSFHNII